MILITKEKDTGLKMFQIKWQNDLFMYFSEVCPLLNIINRKCKQTSESVF